MTSPDAKKPALSWHVLGGNNQHHVGANCGLCVYEYIDDTGKACKKALLFDAGVLPGNHNAPENQALAESDTILPDFARFLYKVDDPTHIPETPIDSIFLTHNHSDHSGALPLLILMGYKVPKIYATPYTAKRLEQDLSNAGIDPSEWPQIYAIAPGKPVVEGPVHVTAFWVSHSTPQAAGFFIETPQGNILHPGDFKMDQSVVWGPAFNESQFKRIVSKPVDLLLLDSTGADRDCTPVTEGDVRETLRELLDEYPNKRFVVAVMGGYEENLASVAMVAAENDKTLWIAGSAHEQTLSALADTGMSLADHLGKPIDIRILSSAKSVRDLAAAQPRESIVVVTGAGGHANAALTRAAEDRHNALQLNPKTDVIIFCAPSMHGQEASHGRLLSLLRSKGFTVLTRVDAPLYSHAHARLPEIIDFVKMANPKHILPIHGSVELRESCATAMEKMGKDVLRADNGDVIGVSPGSVQSVNPATKNRPPLVGLKTLQGANWNDLYYLMVKTPQENTPADQKPANGNKKHKPKIFDMSGK